MLEKVLITGGAGFIGSHVADKLILYYDVSILDNLSTGSFNNINRRAKFYRGDVLTDSEAVFKKEKPDYLVHHAAQINVRSSINDPINDAKNNIIGSLKLFEACRKFGIKKVIFASSGGTIYGNARIPAKEQTLLKPLSPYGIAKATIENYLEFYFKNFGIESVSLRYSNVYGPRQNPGGEAGVIAVFIEKMLRKETPYIWGDGKQTRDFVYVEDVAEANLSALKYKGFSHFFNIGSEKETSINEIFNILKEIFDSENPTYNLDYKEEIPRVLLDCSAAKGELGWKNKTDLIEGIKKTAEWFKKRC